MENGKEVLARIPNPNAGHSQYCVASEVATLDFNSELRCCSSGHGSLYYKDAYACGRDIVNLGGSSSSNQGVAAKFIIGPTTERSFWENEKRGLDIDRGPWETAQQYLSAVAEREIALIRNLGSKNASSLSTKPPTACDEHVKLLEQFQFVLPYILPRNGFSSPVLLHHDLRSDNIFVDNTDPAKISSIIDWQAVYSSPLFMQARFPSVFNSDDPYPWDAVQPELPEDFDTLSQPEKDLASDRLDRIRLKKFYELASRKFNLLLVKAMDAMRNDDDPTTFIFHIVGQFSLNGPIPLRELLIQIHEKWNQIAERRGLGIPCPISFSKEEIDKGRRQVTAWANAYAAFDSLRMQVMGKDGWVSHEEYEEAMCRWEDHRETLETLRERLDKLLL